MKLAVLFAGWMQCRLATDPDPYDEPRGVTGYTFALPGEPDLDRVLRLQGGVPRRFGPPIGVRVHTVRLRGRRVVRHPLVGAEVDLLDDPVFEGRNGLAAAEREEPILPFHIRIHGGGVTLRHAHRDAAGAFLPLEAVGVREGDPSLLLEAGLPPARALLGERRFNLQHELLEGELDPVERAGVEARLDALDARIGVLPVVERTLAMVMTHAGTLIGDDREVSDPEGRLLAPVARGPWLVELRSGAYDSDTLCGWISGHLVLPVGRVDDIDGVIRRFRAAPP